MKCKELSWYNCFVLGWSDMDKQTYFAPFIVLVITKRIIVFKTICTL